VTKRPSWVRDLEDAPSETFVGIVVGVTDRDVPLIHTGVAYRDSGAAPPRMLHLAFHAIVKDEALPHESVHYYCSFLGIDEDRAAALAGFCRRVARRGVRVPYGVLYDGGRVADDGTVELAGRTVGLTCATYVLVVLEWGLFGGTGQLLDVASWQPRDDDRPWHEHIVDLLRDFRVRHPDLITDEHIRAVAAEKGCARFRPEEVAAAAALPWPASFAAVEPEGKAARHFLLATGSG
jgi:hypothetical protein